MFRKPDGAGKGDAPRPTDWDKYSNNYDQIFKKKIITDDGQGVEGVHRPLDTTEHPPEETK